MSGNEMEIFSQEWAEELGRALNANDAYRRAAANWVGSLVFAIRDGGPAADSGAFLDLSGGSCRAARRATMDDLAGADYVLRADVPTWQKLLAGQTDAMFALMTGKLEVARGGLAGLIPHAAAAQQLVRTAVGVGGRFPGA